MVLEEVLKTYTGNTLLFNTSWTKEIPAVSFISSLVTNKVKPRLFSNYSPTYVSSVLHFSQQAEIDSELQLLFSDFLLSLFHHSYCLILFFQQGQATVKSSYTKGSFKS